MADMKKMPSTFLNMVVVLTVIALVSGLALAFTYSSTKDAIDQVQVKKTLKALTDVLPEFDNDPNAEGVKYMVKISDDQNLKPEFRELELYPAKKGDQYVGTAVKTYSRNAFDAPIWLMVGFDKDHKVNRISVLSQKETPGLGTKMAEPNFKGQFEGKDPKAFVVYVTKDKDDSGRKGQVDAISAATITSRAFCEAVRRAHDALLKGKQAEAPAETKVAEKAEEGVEKTPVDGAEVKTEEAAEVKPDVNADKKVDEKVDEKVDVKTDEKAEETVEKKEVK